MKTLKTFVAGCYSEVLLQEAASEKGKEKGAIEDAGANTEEKPSEGAEATTTTPAPPPPYHAGLGARFRFPGDPRK